MQPNESVNPHHSSNNTQIKPQPKNQSLKLDHRCQSNETNRPTPTHMQSLFCSETCDSVAHHNREQEVITGELCEKQEEDNINGRERLKKHRIEVAGRVWIPDIWGQEEMLKDWIDCSAFDASLFPSGITSARAALVRERRRANSGGLRLENRC